MANILTVNAIGINTLYRSVSFCIPTLTAIDALYAYTCLNACYFVAWHHLTNQPTNLMHWMRSMCRHRDLEQKVQEGAVT